MPKPHQGAPLPPPSPGGGGCDDHDEDGDEEGSDFPPPPKGGPGGWPPCPPGSGPPNWGGPPGGGGGGDDPNHNPHTAMFGFFFQHQTSAFMSALLEKDKDGSKGKVAESFKPPPLPTVEKYRQWEESLRKTVQSGIASKPQELIVWWNEIENAFERHKSVHISVRADCVVADLKDSGSFLEWDVKIATGGMKQLIGHSLEVDVAEESRTASDAGEIYKGRQLYARIFAFYKFDVQNNALMTLGDLQTVRMQDNVTNKCLRDWDFVFSRLDPDFQKLFTGKVEVDMFYKLIKNAPHHERHFRDWDLYNEVDDPERWTYMHSMTYIRRVIRSYYDKKLRDDNRGKHHLGIQKGVPGFNQVISGADVKPAGPAPRPSSGWWWQEA